MPSTTLQVGDIVTFPFGPRVMRAKVVEVRGEVGVGRRQIVVIEVEVTDEGGEPLRFEMPSEDLTVEAPAAA